MRGVALRMLLGDPAKYLALVFGIAFATVLMANQVSSFWSLMLRTASQITDVRDGDVWVMDPRVRQVDEIQPMPESARERVRSVDGVAWATPLFKGLAVALTPEGALKQITLMGVDNETLAGAPRLILHGRLDDLRGPDAVMMDRAGWAMMWPGEPFVPGRVLEFNGHRAVIVALCDASPTFTTYPVVFAKYSDALAYSAVQGRTTLPFVLAKAAGGTPPREVARAIAARTGLKAMTSDDFAWATIRYYMVETGIPVNFAVTVSLGFLVGVVVVGQTLYLFVYDNLRQFGALKAMGASNGTIVAMVLLQSVLVAAVGYGLGVGMNGAFFYVAGSSTDVLRGFRMTWEVLAGVGLAVAGIVVAASLFSVRTVLRVDPALVFRS